MRATVFLCGPVTGQTSAQMQDWRRIASERLGAHNIVALDPTRQIIDATVGSALTYSDEVALERLQHGHAVTQRDRFDVQRSDLVLANFLGATGEEARVSIGSVGELFWADAYRKPIVLVREKEGNIHDHAMLSDLAGWIFHDLEVALEAVIPILRT